MDSIEYLKSGRLIYSIILLSLAICVSGCDRNSADGSGAQDSISSSDNKTEKSGIDKTDDKGGNPVVVIKTTKGDIKVELDKEKAPITVDNFMAYVEDGYYNGTIFHRVIKNFMIQGGGITKDMQPKPANAPIKNEADNGLKNDRGTIAMARTGVVDSATSQFFINTVDNGFLNHGARDFGYAVFGRVIDGMDVVEAIEAVPTGPGDVPNEPVVIESVIVVE